MDQIAELSGRGTVLINKVPRGKAEYRIAVYRAEDDTTSGEGFISSGKEYLMIEAENSIDVQLVLQTGPTITIRIKAKEGGSAGVRMISAPGPEIPVC
jgi:hypothetical protein